MLALTTPRAREAFALALTTPKLGSRDTEQPSSILQEKLTSCTPLTPVACDPTQAPWLLGGQGVPQRGKVSATGCRAKWMRETFQGSVCHRANSAEMAAIFHPGFPTEINLPGFSVPITVLLKDMSSHIIFGRNLTKKADSQAC